MFLYLPFLENPLVPARFFQSIQDRGGLIAFLARQRNCTYAHLALFVWPIGRSGYPQKVTSVPEIAYPVEMNWNRSSSTDNGRLREIALILQRAYALSSIEPPDPAGDVLMADMLLALDNPELRDILCEIKALQAEQLQRLERLLSRHADNDP